MPDPYELVPPFISPLTHDQHARLGRIAILWGQIDMILDFILMRALGIEPKVYRTLVGEKPIGAKLSMLTNHIGNIEDEVVRLDVQQFIDLAQQTKTHRNRCFHGAWGFRCGPQEGRVVAAAAHFKSQDDPVRATQLPALEKKLCKTARIGMRAFHVLQGWPDQASARLMHGAGPPPPWLPQWKEQNPVDDDALDHRHKRGQLPYLKKPV